ncbi:MAG: hypothetical protein ACLRMJ_01620 [Alistipes finegoldii]
MTFPDSDIQDRIYMLCDLGDGGSRVQVYDRAAKSLDIFPGPFTVRKSCWCADPAGK